MNPIFCALLALSTLILVNAEPVYAARKVRPIHVNRVSIISAQADRLGKEYLCVKVGRATRSGRVVGRRFIDDRRRLSTLRAKLAARGRRLSVVRSNIARLKERIAVCKRGPGQPPPPDATPTPTPTPTSTSTPIPTVSPTQPPEATPTPSSTPTPSTGWTAFTRSADTRVIYVSSSTGNDGNDGLAPERPVRSIAHGISLLRHGRPDWLLLKRGDQWYESLGQLKKGGRSESEPLLISAYGQGPRPLLKTGSNGAFYSNGGGSPPSSVDYLAIVGLDFYAHTRNPRDPEYRGESGSAGIVLQHPHRDLLVEDCVFRYYMSNNIQHSVRNFKLRRSVIAFNYRHSDDGHAQGVYVGHYGGDSTKHLAPHGVLIEENVFYKNGWHNAPSDNPSGPYYVPGSLPTIYNHNIYVQYNGNGVRDVTVRGNLILDGSSHGLQLRPGGVVENNLFVRNAAALFVAGPARNRDGVNGTSIVRDNVVLEGRDVRPDHRVATGIEVLGDTYGAILQRNIVANKHPDALGAGYAYGIGVGQGLPRDNYENVTLTENISYDWRANEQLLIDWRPYDNLNIADNIFQDRASQSRIIHHVRALDLTRVGFARNTYFTNRSSASWFQIAGAARSFAQWVAATGEPGAKAIERAFVDSERSLATYHGMLGRTPTYEAFVAEALLQSKDNWRVEYTAPVINDYIRAGFAAP